MSVSQQLGRQAAFMEKAASLLRSLVKVTRLLGKDPAWILSFKGKNIGYVKSMLAPGSKSNLQITSSYLQPKWRGMGLGKKVYGDILRDLKPGQTLYSDSSLSAQAAGTWKGLKQRADEMGRMADYGGAESPWNISRSAKTKGNTAEGYALNFMSGDVGIYNAQRNPYMTNLRGKPMATKAPPLGRKSEHWQQDLMDDMWQWKEPNNSYLQPKFPRELQVHNVD